MGIKYLHGIDIDGNVDISGQFHQQGGEAGFGTLGPGYGTLSISNSDNNYHTILGKDGGFFSQIDGHIELPHYGNGNELHNANVTLVAKYALGVASDGKLIELPLNIDFTAITHSSNTHTIDFNSDNQNYTITAQNATNTIAFSNLAAADIGKAGNIIITNPGTVTSLAWAALPATAYTPGGAAISFDLTAGKIAVLSYLVIASDKVLINYVGNFGAYPQ